MILQVELCVDLNDVDPNKCSANPVCRLDQAPPVCGDQTLKINEILSKSMEIQSSKIPGSDDFEDFIISNSCLAISGLLKHYLQSLNLVCEAQVIFGVMLWDANARDGPDDFEGKN